MKSIFCLITIILFHAAIAQNVGIGISAPLQKLHVAGNTYFNGKVGIDDSSPEFSLSFGQALGDKLSLWSNSNVSYGFGIQSLLLQIHTDGPDADIAFGHGSSAVFNEKMRIKGTGLVGIGTTNPTALLDVNGGIKAVSVHTPNLAITSGANQYDFLMMNNNMGDVSFRKGHGGSAVNFIICIEGIFPSNSGPRPQYNDAMVGEMRMFAGLYPPVGWALVVVNHC